MFLYKIFHQHRRLDVNELFNSYTYGSLTLIDSSQELNIPLNYSTQMHFTSASNFLANLPHDPPVRFYDDNDALTSHPYNTEVLVNE